MFLDGTSHKLAIVKNREGRIRCRRYAVNLPARKNQTEDFIDEVVVGPVIIDARSNQPVRSVLALWSRLSNEERLRRLRDPLLRKRERLWQCGPRNHLIAELAAAMRGRNDEIHKLVSDQINFSDWFQQSDVNPQVAVLVESVEHGRQLASLLPNWQLKWSDPSINLKRDRHLINCQQTIVTMSQALQTRLVADVVIRADGTETPWNKKWLCFRNAPRRSPILIIDLKDEFDDVARMATGQRQNDYITLGWQHGST